MLILLHILGLDLTIKQIKVGYDNFTYIIYDQVNKKATIVDPGFDSSKTLSFILSNNLDLEYIILTHYHSDHTSSSKKIINEYPNSKVITSKLDSSKLCLKIEKFVDDKSKLSLGNITLDFLLTPGHTPGSICIIVDNKAILTGDTLFIGDCGRADLPGGSVSDLFNSIQRIKKLPDSLIVYPGHDYGSIPFDSLKNQKKTNKTLIAKTLNDFSKIP